MQTALRNTTNTRARACNAHLGAHDGRWISLPEVKALLARTGVVAPRADRALLAGALRNGRVRLSPKAAKYVGQWLQLPGESAPEALANWLVAVVVA